MERPLHGEHEGTKRTAVAGASCSGETSVLGGIDAQPTGADSARRAAVVRAATST